MFRSFLLVLMLLGVALAVLSAAEPTTPSKTPMARRVGPSSVGSTGGGGAAPGATAGDASTATGKGPVVERCPIKLKTEVDVPGIEAGVLMSLEAVEGMEVRGGMTLGHIDDREPKMEKKINQIKHDAAKIQAENDIDIRYSKLAAGVAMFTFLKNKEAVGKVKNAVAPTELKKMELEADKARLGIDKAIIERQRLAYEAEAKGAEVESADLSIQRRQIQAPFDGMVTNVYCHPGEWVSPGDRVIKVVRLDLLRVEGTLKATDYDPQEIDGRPVTIEAELAHGRKVKFTGKVVFVSPLVSVGGSYDVFAEVNNRQEDGQWVLRPGLEATMTIHLK